MSVLCKKLAAIVEYDNLFHGWLYTLLDVADEKMKKKFKNCRQPENVFGCEKEMAKLGRKPSSGRTNFRRFWFFEV